MKPHFPVAWTRVEVRLLNDLRAQSAGSLHDRIKVIHLEPDEDTVSGRRCVGIDKIGVIFFIPGVKLKNQLTGTEDPVVYVAMAVVG